MCHLNRELEKFPRLPLDFDHQVVRISLNMAGAGIKPSHGKESKRLGVGISIMNVKRFRKSLARSGPMVTFNTIGADSLYKNNRYQRCTRIPGYSDYATNRPSTPTDSHVQGMTHSVQRALCTQGIGIAMATRESRPLWRQVEHVLGHAVQLLEVVVGKNHEPEFAKGDVRSATEHFGRLDKLFWDVKKRLILLVRGKSDDQEFRGILARLGEFNEQHIQGLVSANPATVSPREAFEQCKKLAQRALSEYSKLRGIVQNVLDEYD